MRSDALGAQPAAPKLIARVREVVGLLEPPDPRPPLPARRPHDRIDRLGVVRPIAVGAIAVVALAVLGVVDILLALLAVVLACALLLVRRARRGIAWTRARAAHRREYVEHLADL